MAKHVKPQKASRGWHNLEKSLRDTLMAPTRQLLANNLKFLMSGRPDLGTQQKLAEKTQGRVGQTTIGRILRCETDAGVDTVMELAKCFRLSISDMLDAGLIGRLSGSGSGLQGTKGATGLVPLISWVTAGMLHEAIDNLAPGDAERWIETPFRHGENTFCLKLVGLSMSPDYRDGEIIQVDPDVPAEHGKDVVVRTPDGLATFKRLQISETGEQYLMALNPDLPDRIIKVPEGTIICGVCTGSWLERG